MATTRLRDGAEIAFMDGPWASRSGSIKASSRQGVPDTPTAAVLMR
jgi:hypothetical protein